MVKSKNVLYERWKGMRARCNNKNHRWYKNYGGKGIRVCSEWSDFAVFQNDMYESFLAHTKKHGRTNTSLDRLDSSKGYSKENCRWATRKEQSFRTSRVVLFSCDGIEMNLREWAEHLGANPSTLYAHFRKTGTIKGVYIRNVL